MSHLLDQLASEVSSLPDMAVKRVRKLETRSFQEKKGKAKRETPLRSRVSHERAQSKSIQITPDWSTPLPKTVVPAKRQTLPSKRLPWDIEGETSTDITLPKKPRIMNFRSFAEERQRKRAEADAQTRQAARTTTKAVPTDAGNRAIHDIKDHSRPKRALMVADSTKASGHVRRRVKVADFFTSRVPPMEKTVSIFKQDQASGINKIHPNVTTQIQDAEPEHSDYVRQTALAAIDAVHDEAVSRLERGNSK